MQVTAPARRASRRSRRGFRASWHDLRLLKNADKVRYVSSPRFHHGQRQRQRQRHSHTGPLPPARAPVSKWRAQCASRDLRECRRPGEEIVEVARLFEAQEVSPVKDRRVDLWVEISQPTELAVLACDELLAKDGQLDKEIVFGEVEIRTEGRSRAASRIPLQDELNRLVEPRNARCVEQVSQQALGVVCEPRRTLALSDGAQALSTRPS